MPWSLMPSQPASSDRRGRRVVAGVLAVGALLPIAKVLADPLGSVPGTAASDVFKHVWSYWHATALTQWPHTEWLNAPGGGVLMDLLVVPALLLLPVTAVAGAGLTANLVAWLHLWASGGATAALTRQVGGSWVGAAVAGLVVQTAPYMLGYPLMSGVHERLAVWVFPLMATALLAARAGGSRGWAPLAAVGLLVTGLGCQAYVLYGGVLLLVGLPVWVRRREDVRRVLPTVLGLVVAAGLSWLWAWALTEHSAALVPRPGMTVAAFGPAEPGEVALAVATPATLLNPLAISGPRMSGDELYETAYLGAAVLLVAGVGAWRVRQDRWGVRGLAVLGLLAAVLSMGPWMWFGSQPVLEPLHVGLSWVVPFFGRYPPTWQLVAAATPLLAPAIAIAVDRSPKPLIVGIAVMAVILGERVAVLPHPFFVPTVSLAAPDGLEAVSGPGAVVDIPRVVRTTPQASGQVFLGQMHHGQPITASINPGASAWDTWPPALRGASRDWRADVACLRRGGVRWVVLHPDWFDEDGLLRRTVADLTQVVGPPKSQAAVVVFDLGEVTASPPALPPQSIQPQDLVKMGLVGRPARQLAPGRCPAGEVGRSGP